MSPHAVDPAWADRLVGQLETLSELAERLTYRVLELEERLASQETLVASLPLNVLHQGMGEALDLRQRQTEDRLALMEEVLGRTVPPLSQGRPLRALSSPLFPGSRPFLEDRAEDPLFLEESHGTAPEEEDAAFEGDLLDPSIAS
ncbi:MAG: hypothetical protein ACK41W_16570 [Cyanobacteriota bacterium]|jgi:uncharacterized coiled-coil protein SlyX